MPWCRRRLLFSSPDYFQFADFIDVGSFESRIRNPMTQSLNVVTDSKLVFGVGSGANTDSKFGRDAADCALDPQQVTQIGVASIRGWTAVTAPDQAILQLIPSLSEFSKSGDPASSGKRRLI